MRDLISKGFEIKNGKVYGRGESIPKYDLQWFNTWGGNPRWNISGCFDYNITKNYYGEWYLFDGSSPKCKLNYHGGEHWTSY